MCPGVESKHRCSRLADAMKFANMFHIWQKIFLCRPRVLGIVIMGPIVMYCSNTGPAALAALYL